MDTLYLALSNADNVQLQIIMDSEGFLQAYNEIFSSNEDVYPV